MQKGNVTQLFMYDSQRARELLLEIPDINAVNMKIFQMRADFKCRGECSTSGMLEEIEQVVRFYNSRKGQ